MKSIDYLKREANSDKKHSSISQAEIIFDDQTKASNAFMGYKENLLNLNCWNQSGNLSKYRLFDLHGKSIRNQKLSENLLLRISLKGSGKYDWVKIIELNDSLNEMIVTVQPTFDPNDKEAKSVSHFFTEEARNNFCLQLLETKVFFFIIGLNEKQNVAQTDDFVEAIRNWVAANVGTYLGIQKSEWSSFAEKFLQLGKGKV